MGVDPDGEQELERRAGICASLKDLVHYEATFGGEVLDLDGQGVRLPGLPGEERQVYAYRVRRRWATRAAISCKATPPWATG